MYGFHYNQDLHAAERRMVEEVDIFRHPSNQVILLLFIYSFIVLPVKVI